MQRSPHARERSNESLPLLYYVSLYQFIPPKHAEPPAGLFQREPICPAVAHTRAYELHSLFGTIDGQLVVTSAYHRAFNNNYIEMELIPQRRACTTKARLLQQCFAYTFSAGEGHNNVASRKIKTTTQITGTTIQRAVLREKKIRIESNGMSDVVRTVRAMKG